MESFNYVYSLFNAQFISLVESSRFIISPDNGEIYLSDYSAITNLKIHERS